MKQKLKLLFDSQGLIHSIRTLLGSTFAAGLSAIALIIYSRTLGPEKFGEFSGGFALVMIMIRLNDIGLNTTILKFGAKKQLLNDRNFIFSYTLKIKLFISLLIMLFGSFFSQPIANFLNFSDSRTVIVAMTIGLATVYYEQLLNVLQSLHRFNQAIAINITQAITKIAGALLLLSLHSSSALFAFSWYSAATIIPVIFWKKFTGIETKINFSFQNIKIKNKINKLALHSSIGLIAAGLIENIDILYLQKQLSTYEVGLYSGVSRISLVFALAAYSLGNVLYPRVAQYKNKSDIKNFIKKAFLIVLISIVGFLLFIPFGKISILLTVGSQYISGINILYLLTAASFLAIASIPFIALFFSFNANWYFSISGILQLIVVIVGNTIFVPKYGLEAAAWTRVATRTTLFIFTFIVSMILYIRKYEKTT